MSHLITWRNIRPILQPATEAIYMFLLHFCGAAMLSLVLQSVGNNDNTNMLMISWYNVFHSHHFIMVKTWPISANLKVTPDRLSVGPK